MAMLAGYSIQSGILDRSEDAALVLERLTWKLEDPLKPSSSLEDE